MLLIYIILSHTSKTLSDKTHKISLLSLLTGKLLKGSEIQIILQLKNKWTQEIKKLILDRKMLFLGRVFGTTDRLQQI